MFLPCKSLCTDYSSACLQEQMEGGREGGRERESHSCDASTVRTFMLLNTGCLSLSLCCLDIKSRLALNKVCPSVSHSLYWIWRALGSSKGEIFSVTKPGYNYTPNYVTQIHSSSSRFKFKLSFIVIPLHVWTYSGTRCRASQDHGAT